MEGDGEAALSPVLSQLQAGNSEVAEKDKAVTPSKRSFGVRDTISVQKSYLTSFFEAEKSHLNYPR